MSYNGSEFYDQDGNFTSYMKRRQGTDNANDTLEKPVICELLGEVEGKRVLDLGCGDARFARELFERGCESYTGIEGSRNMLRLAQEALAGYNAQVIHTRMESWDYPRAAYDLVLSRLALHYIEGIDQLLYSVYAALKPGGRLVFSVEHPVITSTLQPSGKRTDWVVDRYFIEGYREQQWLGGTVRKYHRSLEQYYRALQDAGFAVEHLRESTPQRQHFEHEETYQRRLRIPLFLFLAARKKG